MEQKITRLPNILHLTLVTGQVEPLAPIPRLKWE